MTSGNFQVRNISTIFVDRETRQRRELSGIEELADSIRRVGLINPPVIRENGELIAGERRFTACKQLGWTSIPVQYLEDLSEYEARQVELEENVRRLDLPWQDQCKAVAAYHELRKQEETDWTVQKTVDALGYSLSWVKDRLQVAKELSNGNARVAAAPKYSTAKNIVMREAERARANEAIQVKAEPEAVPILNVDFEEWVKTYDGPPFNLIHCDFPYGVNADKHNQGAAASHGGYSDDFDTYARLIDTLGKGPVAESAHLIFWFSMDYYGWTLEQLNAQGWHVDPFPLIWFKSDNTGILPDPNRGPRRVYETAFFARRGDRKVVQAVGNCIGAASTKEFHMSEKALPMLRHFFRMVCDEHSTVLDPTCGSGNALVAAAALRAGNVLGLERDKEFFDRACENWRRNGPTALSDGEGDE